MGASGAAEYAFSVAVLGDPGVGKTALIRDLSEELDDMDAGAFTTHGVGPHITRQRHSHKGRDFHVEVHDLPGSAHFLQAADLYCAPMAGLAFVFDVTSYDTFASAQEWIDRVFRGVRATKRRAPALVLLGNKKEVPPGTRREVSSKSAKMFAQDKGMAYFEVSAATGDGVETAFDALLEAVCERVPAPEEAGAGVGAGGAGRAASALQVGCSPLPPANATARWEL